MEAQRLRSNERLKVPPSKTLGSFRPGSFGSAIRCMQHILDLPLPDCLPTYLRCPAT